MDFMYLDSEIVVLVREHPDLFADHEHAAYFTNEGHARPSRTHAAPLTPRTKRSCQPLQLERTISIT
jgi:hypothetical protein